MITFLVSAIKIIVLLGVLITIHELGHFIVAKLCKVKVNEFAIGFRTSHLEETRERNQIYIEINTFGRL